MYRIFEISYYSSLRIVLVGTFLKRMNTGSWLCNFLDTAPVPYLLYKLSIHLLYKLSIHNGAALCWRGRRSGCSAFIVCAWSLSAKPCHYVRLYTRKSKHTHKGKRCHTLSVILSSMCHSSIHVRMCNIPFVAVWWTNLPRELVTPVILGTRAILGHDLFIGVPGVCVCATRL